MMELLERGEEKQFVQVQFGKVEPATRWLSSGAERQIPETCNSSIRNLF